MKLTQQQIDILQPRRLAVPARAVQPGGSGLSWRARPINIYDANRPEVWREKSGAPRTAFARASLQRGVRRCSAPIRA